MGVLRLLLALSVVLDHTFPLPEVRLPGGDVAVESFFIISGFYMALVLTGKYALVEPLGLRLRVFAVARLLRLFPTYLVVLVLTLLVHLVLVRREGPAGWTWSAQGHLLDPLAVLATVAANLLIVGQEVVTWTVIDPSSGGMHLTTSGAGPHELSGYDFLLVPQAWSLSLELCFYALAPFLVRRSTPVLVGVTGASLALRLAMPALGLGSSLWSYRFFPAELGLFLLGVLGHRAYRTARDRVRPVWGWAALAVLVAATLAYGRPDGAKHVAFVAAVAVSVPVLFATFRRSSRDRRTGDLSYPVYICHLLVLTLVQNLPGPPLGHTGTALATLVGSVVLAQLLILCVDGPVEQRRQAAYAREVPARTSAEPEPQALP